jgi:lathosterol oxidase
MKDGPFLGLDWFLLNLIVFSLVFVPLEQLFARRPDQPIFRPSWITDLTYFFVSAVLVQLTTILTLKPAMILFAWAANAEIQSWVASLPFILQFLGILFFADLTQYWVHRLFHAVPVLWRFHAVHHSAESMDWLAGSRLHLVDVAVTRALSYIPIYVLGFAEGPLFAYIVLVSIQATFIHSNLRFEFGPLRWLTATPQFHHWHHCADPQLFDKNFAVHLPFLDWVFGTYYLPKGVWPTSYGVGDGAQRRSGYFGQMIEPFLAVKPIKDPSNL